VTHLYSKLERNEKEKTATNINNVILISGGFPTVSAYLVCKTDIYVTGPTSLSKETVHIEKFTFLVVAEAKFESRPDHRFS
jgi:hypothetical protein